jgi:hypothetical protein
MPQAGAKGSARNMLASFGLRLRQQCQFLISAFFVKKHFFEKELIKKTKEMVANVKS